MRFLILGAGSVGLRHLRNIVGLGHEVPMIFDPDPSQLRKARKISPASLFTSDEREALRQETDAVLICSPTHLHLQQALAAIRAGKHVFIEKPLSHSLDGTEVLATEASRARRIVLVACNLRFFPSLVLVKRLLDEGRIGKLLSVRALCGYYLPYWRPGEDYRAGYGARQGTGGGVILDCIHEFDYLRWLVGSVSEVFCYAGRMSTLEIDVEDTAEVLLRFKGGTLASIHLDYLQRTYRRSCELIGEEGVLVWDYISAEIRLYGKEDRHCQVFQRNINYDLNEMFVDEMKHFSACIEGRESPALDAAGGREVLEIALAAKLSAAEGRVVRLGDPCSVE